MSSEENINLHLSEFPQTIEFGERDVNFEIISSDVSVTTSSGNHEKGSSKVKLKNIVDYSWEVRFYTGQLIAVNPSGKYIAYGIQLLQKLLATPAVRIWNRETDKRALIKGLEGGVQDLAFAHSSDVILGIVDSAASLLVHRIDEDSNGNIVTSIILNVLQNQPDPSNGINVNSYATQRHRIIWCPYIPDPSETNHEDSSKLLVLTHGNKAELWKISEVATQYGPGPHVITQLVDGYLGFTEHSQPIVDAAFSPDGTALATASLDGEVKFFQVYLYNATKPRCLHMWTPHQGRPLSSLFFLDNHKDYNPNFLFWKYAVTGANDNSELKLWSCESWKCLQTIRFTPGINDGRVRLKAVLDATATYLILSDMDRKLLYVLEITPQSEFGDAMFVRCIAEFPVLYPALALCIFDAGVSKLKEDCTFTIDDMLNEKLFSDDCDDEPQPGVEATVIKMFLVQPKSLQECHIAFQSRSKSKNFILNETKPLHLTKEEVAHENKELNEEIQANDGGENDIINDLNIKHNTTGGSSSNNTLVQISGGDEGVSLNLMTPEAFSSPGKRETSSDALAESIDTQLNSVINIIDDDTLQLHAEHRDGAFASAGSSPSREVQEILSHRGSSASNVVASANDFYPNLKSPSITVPNEYKTTSSESVVSAIDSTVVTTAASTDGWSQIPMMLVDEVRKSESTNMRNSSELQDTIDSRGNIAKNTTKLESMLNSLVVTNQSLTNIIHKQSLDILSLQEELQSQKEHLEKSCATIQQDVSRIEERTLVQQSNLLENLTQFTQKTVTSTTKTVLTEAIRDTLVPGMVSALEPLKFQLKTDVANKLTATDKILHENIAKLVCNKTVIDTLAETLTKCLESVAQKSFHQVFESMVLPHFDKALQALFGQLNETFSSGTKEYMNNVDIQIEKHRKHGDKSRNDIVTQIQTINENVCISNERLLACVKNDIVEQMRTHTNSINESISLIIKEQISQALKAHQTLYEDTLLRSGSSTPASHMPDTQVQQTQLTQLLKQGNVTAAFQQALSASNLSLVMFVCEHANPKHLFSRTPCIFPQNVLLSLIQQLSADLSQQTELKLSFLSEAVMVLERSNPVTREHLPIVLNELIKGLSTYISTHQNNEIARQMKMLLMATNSLLN